MMAEYETMSAPIVNYTIGLLERCAEAYERKLAALKRRYEVTAGSNRGTRQIPASFGQPTSSYGEQRVFEAGADIDPTEIGFGLFGR